MTDVRTGPDEDEPNQFSLLRQRRFAPFFGAQVTGAANDNLFKFALTVLITYQLNLDWLPAVQTGPVIGALFVLPLLLCSAPCGQLVDKYDIADVTRALKWFELVVMIIAAIGFAFAWAWLLLVCVFLMGMHSALIGTIKFAYLPRHLGERELTGGNGVMESGLFAAILVGNIVGGLLVVMPGVGHVAIGLACVALAAAGLWMAWLVPSTPATDPGLRIRWNPFTETARNLALARANTTVFRSILGTSWLWFFGAMFLGNFPAFARTVLGGDEHVASMLLVIFLVGIGTGSLLCEMLSRRHVEIGLIPLGAVGMSILSIELYFATVHVNPAVAASGAVGTGADAAALLDVMQFVARPGDWRVMVDLFGLSLFCGLYCVPMYALIQLRSDPVHRARIVAANNVLNGIFMTASSILSGVFLHLGFSLPQLFLFTGIANVLVATYIFLVVPDYLLRFLAWIVSHGMYRIRVAGDEHLPVHGPAVLVSNQVSYVDALLLMAVSPRPIRFLIDERQFARPLLGKLLRIARAIPLGAAGGDGREQSIETARGVLEGHGLVGVFPEGGMTRDGELQPFHADVVNRLASPDVPIVPMALTNLWGSYFSAIEGAAMKRPFRRGLFSRVGVHVGEPVQISDVRGATRVDVDALHAHVAALLRGGG